MNSPAAPLAWLAEAYTAHPNASAVPPDLTPEALEACLLYEDDDVCVFNKPGWLVCHPAKRGPWSSLVSAARERLGVERLHLIARLDRETSGLVILARHPRAARPLQIALEQRQVEKHYRALVHGELTERREVSRPLEDAVDSPVAVQQRISRRGTGRKAQTTFVPLAHAPGYTWVEAVPHTGRKHQIRVHAQHIGHSIVGDKLYGPDPGLYLEFVESGWTQRLAGQLGFPRQALHAAHMTFTTLGQAYHAPLPDDLRTLLTHLGFPDRSQGL